MSRALFRILTNALVVLALGLSPAPVSAQPVESPSGDASEALRTSLGTASLAVRSLERVPITNDVAWYRFRLQVGPGPYDEILVHRVVRERAPWVTTRTRRGVFLTHGDGWGFAATFLTSLGTPAVADTRNLPVFLAQNGIDVWGLDFRWALVPVETPDLSFMAGWGFGTSLEDLDHGLVTARLVRAATGSGAGRLHLLGFSRGGQIGWAQLSAETRRPAARRHVRGFVAAEHTFKTDDEAVRQGNCASYTALEELLASGAVANDSTIVAEIGDLATSAPNDPSPFFPVVSNADFAELIGADVAGGSIPYFHSVGGVIDPETLATELLYTEPALWFAFLSGISPYRPWRISLDGAAVVCDELDSPFDDHLSEVEVPILYLGAAGAFGERGLYTTTLTGSSDVSSLILSAGTSAEQEYGHNELFLATSAQALVWQPILDWVEAH